MKLITFASASHLPMLREFFLESYFRFPQGIDELTIFKMPQPTPIPEFGSVEYWNHSRRQAVVTADYLRQCKAGEIVLSADCDIQWFGPLDELVKLHPDKVLAAQYDPPDILCGGFMRFIVCESTIRLCDAIVAGMSSPEAGHATKWLNQAGFDLGISRIGFDLNQVWSQRYVWKSGDAVPPPPTEMIVHHASWVLDLGSKIELLRAVKALKS